MCVTFKGTIERFNLYNIHMDSPYISCDFLTLVLPRPTVDLVIGNIPGVKTLSPEDTYEWNKRNGFQGRNCTSMMVSKRQSTRVINRELSRQHEVLGQLKIGSGPPLSRNTGKGHTDNTSDACKQTVVRHFHSKKSVENEEGTTRIPVNDNLDEVEGRVRVTGSRHLNGSEDETYKLKGKGHLDLPEKAYPM